ncbi:uncharacterized protein DMENIID0001_165700 [Sergentomyia squamirostris]
MEPQEKKNRQESIQELSPKSILDLNDDCLEEIFTNFSVRELVEVDKVCPRFRSIIEQCFYKKEDVLDINMKHDGKEVIADLAERLGPHVDTLDITGRSVNDKLYTNSWWTGQKIDDGHEFIDVETFKPLWIHCIKIEILVIRDVDLRHHLEFMKEIFKSLEAAEFTSCQLTDEIGQYLGTSSKLDELSLAGNPKITGTFLAELKNQLVALDMRRCLKMMQDCSFGAFCKDNLKLEMLSLSLPPGPPDTTMRHLNELKNLKWLRIVDSELAPPSAFLPNFPNLKHLKIFAGNDLLDGLSSMNGFLDSVADTDSVEDLRIDGSYHFHFDRILPKFTKLVRFDIDMLLNDFEESHLLAINMESRRTLEHLEISKTDEVTEKGLLEFVKDCPKLKYLNIRLNDNITNDFIYGLLPFVKDRPQCLEICCNSTSITEDMEEVVELRGNGKIELNWNLLNK